MKRIIITLAVMTAMLTYVLSSCYKNKEDILTLPAVSFRSDVVPIMTSGACGCHNNGIGTRAVQFSHADTVFYDAITCQGFGIQCLGKWRKASGRRLFADFKANEKNIIKRWIIRRFK